ncbi:hypothetical protein MYCTH_2300840 [Thermothelomyces thermophilus ATCC 42464]|uniref:Uncharacterized protein n=1 Tax=Thermothelomyces thermophilus (strain ATCC 42464 / BCRC 31852 / DSM 1799) TaxID=573729 RepID=G2Q897_THET4|nr:uncharacterized protein MYCTH_2300840 [Thermothelomyces thermophilus ATCC 42464]AEO56200.1 hypothetical protein MYCTH_2300840 [Thermothelomyces thermophilus ATCC 42464]
MHQGADLGCQLFRSLSAATTSDSRTTTGASTGSGSSMREKLGLGSIARRTLGITLLLIVVFLWTLSNFLASYIFSDGTYNKPFFLVYVNTSCFAISLIPLTIRYVKQNGVGGLVTAALQLWREKRSGLTLLKTADEEGRRCGAAYDDGDAAERLLVDDEAGLDVLPPGKDEKLSVGETARLSLEFSLLWFAANYFASACLEYTSVGSVTILTSTSSIWTLVFCALTKVETFTLRKLVGVLASLVGVVLISSVDLSGANDDSRGSFPHKTTVQIAIGDSMAFFSAIIYGVYVTVMKRRVGNEERVNMPLFFGLVGLFNVLFLWPGFFILHYTGIEPFELPPSASVWTIIAVNSMASFFSDILWAYAMLLTTPLVVTVGLSLNIPLSLIGEMIQYSQYSSWLYWVGAGIVFISFLFINNETYEETTGGDDGQVRGVEGSAA